MTKEELLSKDTFMSLFAKNDFDRIAEEDRLFLEAES